jgi:hypothetical protein
MKKEINDKAVELSDEEMDRIVGGNAMAMVVSKNAWYSYLCRCPGISPNELHNAIQSDPNTCFAFSALFISKSHYCLNCRYYDGSYSGSLKDGSMKREISNYTSLGYKVGQYRESN